MKGLLCAEDVYVARHGLRKCYVHKGHAKEQVLQALLQPGEVLKQSKKSRVRRVGAYAIKASRGRFGIGLLKHTFQRGRCRRAWIAAHHLRRHGVGVPEPVAYIEKGLLGVVAGSVLVTQYLKGCRNVEQFLVALVQRGAGKDTVALFLAALAEAVNRLCASGACHADLSGKNIFTRDGRHFYFIDLDSVQLDVDYDDARRLKNHVELYDSFCDLLNDAMLVPFIERMLTPRHDTRIWMPQVRKGQRQRRSKLEVRRDRQGKKRA